MLPSFGGNIIVAIYGAHTPLGVLLHELMFENRLLLPVSSLHVSLSGLVKQCILYLLEIFHVAPSCY